MSKLLIQEDEEEKKEIIKHHHPPRQSQNNEILLIRKEINELRELINSHLNSQQLSIPPEIKQDLIYIINRFLSIDTKRSEKSENLKNLVGRAKKIKQMLEN